MSYEVMSACADMILASAIEDLAAESNKSIEEVRNDVIESQAYDCLYNFDSGLWRDGPDYFREFYGKIRNTAK